MTRKRLGSGAGDDGVCGLRFVRMLVLGLAWSVLSAGVSRAEDVKVPLGLPAVTIPEGNPQTAEKIALGRQLYFDPRLSSDLKVSCATCHDPARGWSNGDQFATGINNLKGGRNSPTIVNSAYQKFQFWDGRAGSLEDQALGPVQNPIEMNMPLGDVIKRLNGVKGYRDQFQQIFGTDVTEENLARAIAAYERTILSGDAPYDRFKAGDEQALSAGAKRGMDLFFGKAHCSACHTGFNFTDNAFHNVGIGMNAKMIDVGREAVSKLEGDRGAFKTPTCRDVVFSPPYMHDGSLKTLEEVVEHYAKGAIANPYLDEEIFELELNAEEKADLVLFLKEGLTSSNPPMDKAPALPK